MVEGDKFLGQVFNKLATDPTCACNYLDYVISSYKRESVTQNSLQLSPTMQEIWVSSRLSKQRNRLQTGKGSTRVSQQTGTALARLFKQKAKDATRDRKWNQARRLSRPGWTRHLCFAEEQTWRVATNPNPNMKAHIYRKKQKVIWIVAGSSVVQLECSRNGP